MTTKKTLFFYAASILLIAFFIAVYIFYTIPEKPYLKINKTYIPIEIADNDEKRIKGLSYRKSLSPEMGMLFVFQDKAIKSFWMKDMEFPLDIVWIDGDRVVRIDKNAPPAGPDPEKKYPSVQPIDKVLEVNAGFADKNGLAVGDLVRYYLGNGAAGNLENQSNDR